MPDKKKTTVLKSGEKRMSHTPASKRRAGDDSPRGGSPGAVASASPSAGNQLAAFEEAMRLFHARRFQDARDAFARATGGPERDVAQRAQLHIRMCERRLSLDAVALQSAEENYNYGIALINTRNVAAAREHLARALEMSPESDHIHYAMALAEALSGNLEAAAERLRRAIEIEPRNRVAARQDADFAPFANQPPLDALLHPEKRNWPGR